MVMGLHDGTPRGSSTFAYALRDFVNIFGWLGKVRLDVEGVISDPPAQTPVKRGFTISVLMFNILEQSPKKPPRVPAQ
ncbi:hypothetical protein DXT89_00270 [Agrobacterium vitis]|uniref:Uncharacterized protein n=1 Tax=Agrobacterium vitis TaxID=373 RepID=A0A368P0S8_AGRVI|nr:hypothetical protein DXM22_03465 [Agrobacterium vitis]KAA3531863.1 hypothetical protein DXT89_00270 [Agrobacterium vitis]RCU54991.1 hypothetical protein ASB66_008415 [Agrobacterium vitis]